MDNNTKEFDRFHKMLNEYASKVGINIEGKQIVNESYGRLLFKLIVTDYQKGLISVDDLSFLCGEMYQKFEDTDLFDLLLNGTEIEWYMRWSPEIGATFIRDLINEFGTEWVDAKTQ